MAGEPQPSDRREHRDARPLGVDPRALEQLEARGAFAPRGHRRDVVGTRSAASRQRSPIGRICAS